MNYRTTFAYFLMSLTLWLSPAVYPVLAAGMADEAAGDENDTPIVQARWSTPMDPDGPITILAGRAVAANGAGAAGIACPGGGNIATSCREDSTGTLLISSITACRLIDEVGRVLSVSGELVITAPQAGGCQTGILRQCTHVSVRAIRYVATIADPEGRILDTLSIRDRTRVFREVLLPCDARAAG